jgi:hypothetical protein
MPVRRHPKGFGPTDLMQTTGGGSSGPPLFVGPGDYPILIVAA